MNFKEQLKASWPFAVAAGIFILLVIFSTSGLYNVPDIFWGITYILLAVTLTITCLKASKRFQQNGRYGTCARLMYAAGLLSGLWLYEAIKQLF
ncbi:hypothetical protein [Proteiniphilum acetatigenes]|uniref:hypothetical protein n=1 Tax=Proteiniphilum acetatigenes TaxID=294710 RepID=UPI0003A53CA1|nr:hypothetical protein [Proteiniphilum acetatigenes]